jgi:hypothetical protein
MFRSTGKRQRIQWFVPLDLPSQIVKRTSNEALIHGMSNLVTRFQSLFCFYNFSRKFVFVGKQHCIPADNKTYLSCKEAIFVQFLTINEFGMFSDALASL